MPSYGKIMPGYSQLDKNWGEMSAGSLMVSLVLAVLVLAGMWQIFEKAGEAGWKCLIPIYNLYILLKICSKDWWWLLMFLIPVVNLVFIIMLYNALAKSFGHGGGYTVGLLFLPFIFVPMLGFGKDKYKRVKVA